MSAGEGDNFHQIVRLYFYTGTICRPVSAERAADGATVVDNVSFFCVRLGRYRFHQPAALAGAVAGQLIQMAAPQAKGAVIAGGESQRFYLFTAVPADKPAVFFLKSFAVHAIPPFDKYVHIL